MSDSFRTNVHVEGLDLMEFIASLTDFSPGSVIEGFLVISSPQPVEANPYYQHPDGTVKSIKYRQEEAYQVECPWCKAPVGQACRNMSQTDTADPILNRYPHRQRTKEAQRQQSEITLFD